MKKDRKRPKNHFVNRENNHTRFSSIINPCRVIMIIWSIMDQSCHKRDIIWIISWIISNDKLKNWNKMSNIRIRHLYLVADEFHFLFVHMAFPVRIHMRDIINFIKIFYFYIIHFRLQDYFRRLSIASLTSNFLRKREYTRRMTYRIVLR